MAAQNEIESRSRETLTGSRIRERRIMAQVRQADLARQIGISASYLNLIEHNRRRIGGKLLIQIAQALRVEPSMLTEGAEAALIAALREAAVDSGVPGVEVDRAEELAGRFPGWAEVLAQAQRRIASLERTVETLSDRLTHDPHLAASLHDVLSTATSIRSTAAILAEPGDIGPEWRDRFHRNLNEDSQRLASSSKALVRYLDGGDVETDRRRAPREEAEAFVAGAGYHFPALETGESTPAEIIAKAGTLKNRAARRIAEAILTTYREDADRLALDAMRAAIATNGLDPVALARHFATGLDTVFRRLAALPDDDVPVPVGLVVCDASGGFLFRKPVGGFALPRFGSTCPLWPLFGALTRPMTPIRRRVVQLGRREATFDCMAIAGPQGTPDFGFEPVFRSSMLILPASGASDEAALQVGTSCRICPHAGCPARREPSVLGEEF
jgi:predicted transcriptional regulator/DNA-binding XRE family transcriptional regulator